MELQNVNHDASSVSEAFAGVEKMDRIIDKLVALAQHYVEHAEPRTVSELIQKGIELYADTTEEAIGIALGLHNAVVSKSIPFSRKKRTGIIGGKTADFSSFLDSLDKMLDKLEGKKNVHKITEDSDDPMLAMTPTFMLKDYLDSVDCTTCHKLGNCAIRREAAKRGLIDGEDATEQR